MSHSPEVKSLKSRLSFGRSSELLMQVLGTKRYRVFPELVSCLECMCELGHSGVERINSFCFWARIAIPPRNASVAATEVTISPDRASDSGKEPIFRDERTPRQAGTAVHRAYLLRAFPARKTYAIADGTTAHPGKFAAHRELYKVGKKGKPILFYKLMPKADVKTSTFCILCVLITATRKQFIDNEITVVPAITKNA